MVMGVDIKVILKCISLIFSGESVSVESTAAGQVLQNGSL